MNILIRRALLSVSDKTGLLPLARVLLAHGTALISTGGTARVLRDAGIPVTEVSDHTGVPEMLDGRVKTLVPAIHGGILARRGDPDHLAQLDRYGILPIDLVCVNLYPFEQTVQAGASPAACVEQIDIGGPALIRSAAKNHSHVAVLTHPGQYEAAMQALENGGITEPMRRGWAAEAFGLTAAYDATISQWFTRDVPLPSRLLIAATRREVLRYGENPHQQAAFYASGTRPGVATAQQVQGKSLSYNNLADTDAAFECVAEFEQPAVVIVKHGNPCGVATAATLAEAYLLALRCDPVSAFGGVIAANRPIDGAAARHMAALFAEVIVAPGADDDARAVLSTKRQLRLLLTGAVPDPMAAGLQVRSVAGGYLVQTRDAGRVAEAALTTVTARAPTPTELQDLIFAFQVCKHVKSNAIVHAHGGATTGIGAGQMSRVDSARIAAWKGADAARTAGLDQSLTEGGVVASDAFFPFADGLEAAIAAGATAVIQPGGSVRDAEVVAAADRAGIAMVLTGMRHFRH